MTEARVLLAETIAMWSSGSGRARSVNRAGHEYASIASAVYIRGHAWQSSWPMFARILYGAPAAGRPSGTSTVSTEPAIRVAISDAQAGAATMGPSGVSSVSSSARSLLAPSRFAGQEETA